MGRFFDSSIMHIPHNARYARPALPLLHVACWTRKRRIRAYMATVAVWLRVAGGDRVGGLGLAFFLDSFEPCLNYGNIIVFDFIQCIALDMSPKTIHGVAIFFVGDEADFR